MPFRNDIVGGEELIRSAIRSENFMFGSEDQVTGWRIARDGSATFNNLTIGSNSWTINDSGDAVFNTVSTSQIILDGEDLQAILDRRPRGVIKQVFLSGDSPTTTGAGIGGAALFAQLTIPNFEQRSYWIHVEGVRIDCGTATPEYTGIVLYQDVNTPATTSSTIRRRERYVRPATSSVDSFFGTDRFLVITPGGSDDELTLSFYVEASTSGVRVQSDTSSTGFATIVVVDMGIRESFELYDMSMGSTPETQYTSTYNAVWSASWDAGGGFKLSNEHVYQGDYSGSNRRYGKIGFDYTQIQSDLVGATINQVRLRLTNLHTWFNNGFQGSNVARVGTHNTASEPGGSSSTTGSFNQFQFNWNKGQTRWVTLSTAVGNGLRDNTIKGITLGRTNAGTQGEYGYFRGEDGTSSTLPRLEITYTK